MTVTAVVVPPGFDEPAYRHEFSGSLDEYQQVVGGLIEATDVDALGCTLWSNEEGLLLQLPPNYIATEFLYNHAPHHLGITFLVGTVYITGGTDEEGETLSVPQDVLELFDL